VVTMSLRDYIAKIKLNSRKARADSERFDFPAALIKPKQVLVCLPGTLRQLTLVKQFLPTLVELFKPAEVTLLSLPTFSLVKDFVS
jgi:hypothetical protein